jgi:hypothetical protein
MKLRRRACFFLAGGGACCTSLRAQQLKPHLAPDTARLNVFFRKEDANELALYFARTRNACRGGRA